MFLFCCGESMNKEVYEVTTKNNNNTKKVTYTEIDHQKSFHSSVQILKIKKSDYRDLVSQYDGSKNKWEDISFPPNEISVGEIPQVTVHKWKRLSQIVNNPVLFDGLIQPQDVIQGSLGDCYFLSAVAAIAERQTRIKQIFGDQEGAKSGIYKVNLRINGIIEEIVIDDFVPVDHNGQPVFCQPNKSQIWVPLLEKAWAKANGSYGNIIAGEPTELFKAATYAPSQTIYTGNTKQQSERLWKIINENSKRDRPCCCGTIDDQGVDWNSVGLVPGHAYTLISSAEMEDVKGNLIRILKLRNPWGNTEWQGEGCESDVTFWKLIAPSEEKNLFLKNVTINNDGIFFILYSDYCKFFSQTHICYMENTGNYIYQNYFPSKKNGHFWQVIVFQEDEYAIELHQNGTRIKNQINSAISRAALLLLKNSQEGYEFITGVLSNYEEDTSLRIRLKPGKYTIFSKFDPSLEDKQVPTNSSISIYSLHYAILNMVDRLKCKNILLSSFLSHARANKRRRYESNTMWISNKLLFKEGGYAYIAFGAEKQSQHKWIINFNESDFNDNGFKMKKPFKGKGQNQEIQVLPGQEQIILVRVKNQNVKNLKFPPAINWKLVALD